jgi:uncharacterized protein YndB with AHSA1/START domain
MFAGERWSGTETGMAETTASASTTIAAARGRVWNALTDPQLIRQYFMNTTVNTDWQVGHPITFTGTWQDKEYEDKGSILSFEPEEELSFSHWSPLTGTDDTPDNYHVVRITLSDDDGGTRVTLEQSNLNGGVTDADRKSREDYEKNWKGVLDGLKKVVES